MVKSIEGSDMLFGLYASRISFSLQSADSYKENHPMLEHHRLMAILSFRKTAELSLFLASQISTTPEVSCVPSSIGASPVFISFASKLYRGLDDSFTVAGKSLESSLVCCA
uniref:Uncharacterized protein n=1 Tax=Oryza punctata TaxID=4537 RepID=A0A0E0LMT2_ORYPU